LPWAGSGAANALGANGASVFATGDLTTIAGLLDSVVERSAISFLSMSL
jgi:hypothetical protein